MLNIQDRLFVSIKVDGQEIEYANLLSITATEGNGALVPAIKISLTDPTSAFSSSNAITEGNEIEITFAKSFSDNQVRPRKYRIFGPDRGNQPYNTSVDIVGVLNVPKYISKSSIESYNGTSEDVLAQLAGKSGMTFSGPSSIDGRKPNDKQKWLNVCRSRATFAMDVVKHSWIDAHSGMSAALTSYGELRYRDLLALINTPIDKIQFVFTHNALASSTDSKKRSYIVKEARDRSTAGLMSSWQNYGSTRAQNMLSGIPDAHKELEVKMPGNYLPINKSVSDEIDRSRIEYAPLDCGNVHAKYEVAQYQNVKLNALFSEKMSLLVDQVTEVQLYDVVVYRQEDADLRQPIKNTDVYIVMGKTLVVSGGVHYAERIELARMSLTMKGTAELETPGNFASERSMIPDVTINSGSKGILAAANRSSVNSLSGALTSVTGANSILTNAKNTLLSPLTGAMSTLDRIYDQIANGITSPQSVTDLLRSAVAVTGGLSSLSGMVNYISSANGGLLGAVKNSVGAVQGQLISQANSVTSSLVNQYVVALPYQAVTGAMSSALGSMPVDVLQASTDYKELHSLLGQATQNTMGITGNINGQWNSTLGVLRKLEVPTSYSSGVPQIGVNLQQGLRVPAINDQMLLNVVHDGMRKDYGGQPGWIGPQGMTTNTIGESLSSSMASAKDYVNRLTENV